MRESTKEFMRLMGATTMIDINLDAVQALLADYVLPGELKEAMEVISSRKGEIIEMVAEEYEKEFTEEEIEELCEILSLPVMRKVTLGQLDRAERFSKIAGEWAEGLVKEVLN